MYIFQPKNYKFNCFLVLVLCILSINRVNSALDIKIDTRFCDTFQFGGTNEQYANRMKDYVHSCPQNSGYCVTYNPAYPIHNAQLCGANKNIGWIWTMTFTDNSPANYEIDYGTDFGGGSAIFVDGVYDIAWQKDFWWAKDWNNPDVFTMNYNFTPGTHVILMVGQEYCCDGDMRVQFSKNGGPKEPLTKDNFDCWAENKCPVSCTASQYQVGRTCVNCSYKCFSCQNSATTCTQCSSSTREGLTDCNCKPKYYDVNGQAHCNACDSTCKTCSNGSSCETCESGYYLNTLCYTCESKYGAICGTCNAQKCLTCKNDPTFTLPRCENTTCYLNEFKTGQICNPCHSSCTACVDSLTCTQCQADEHLQNGLCVKCSVSYYANCGKCNATQCLECKNDPANKLPDCTSTTCPPTQFADGNTCRDCEARCDVCDNSTTCTTCIAGSYLLNADCPQCQSPCLKCVGSASNCTACVKNNYDVSGGCVNCIARYFKTASNDCASCEQYYGSLCGKCNTTECTECFNNPTYTLPTCTGTGCPARYWKDGNICRPCVANCISCSNSTTCDVCQDLMYKGADNLCYNCQAPCFLCTSQTVCTLCDKLGWAPPNCTTCEGRFLMHNGDCIQTCPIGWYGDYLVNQCKQCNSPCVECFGGADKCTVCPTGKVLHNFQCLDCNQIKGFYQKPGAPAGTCEEHCGDGLRVSTQFQCDDGNNVDGDGCSANCKIEDGWICSGGSENSKDICSDKRPIKFTVEFFFDSQYLNIEENAPLKCIMKFTKPFTLPQNTSLADYVVIKVKGRDTSGFKIKVNERINRRSLASGTPEYDLTIYSDITMKNRELSVDLYPKSAFDDGNGNSLEENEQTPNSTVKEYYYYNDQERYETSRFEFWLMVGVMLMMIFLPFYVFYYKNHFNRFYILFFAIDITQLLYFYRFINIRWPINGIKFFRKLRPTISFYMYNFYEKEISDTEFKDYSSGVEKFDLEKESSLFLNNVGSLLTLFIIFVGLYLIVVLLSIKKLYRGNEQNKMYKLFFHLRHGYFEWGIWFDSMLASSGVFIIYIFLQLSNAKDPLNFFLAIGMAVWYFGFFAVTLIFTKRNLNILYNKEMDEQVEDIPLVEKLEKSKSFKFRNIWHFIHKLEDYPKKSLFYFAYVIRKIYIAIVLLSLQDFPLVQVSMLAFSHLVIIFGLLKFTIFKESRQTARLVISEASVIGSLGCLFYMVADDTEDEHFRQKYSWFVIAFFLFGLFVHALFFFYQEVILPIIEYCLRRKHQKKVVDLRNFRKQGKQENTIIDDCSSYKDRFGTTISNSITGSTQHLGLKTRKEQMMKTKTELPEGKDQIYSNLDILKNTSIALDSPNFEKKNNQESQDDFFKNEFAATTEKFKLNKDNDDAGSVVSSSGIHPKQRRRHKKITDTKSLKDYDLGDNDSDGEQILMGGQALTQPNLEDNEENDKNSDKPTKSKFFKEQGQSMKNI